MKELRKFKNSEGSLRMKFQSTSVENRQLKDQLFLLNALNYAKTEKKNLQSINSQLSNVISDARNKNNRLSNALNGAVKALKRIWIKNEEKVLFIIFMNGVLALLIVYRHVLFF